MAPPANIETKFSKAVQSVWGVANKTAAEAKKVVQWTWASAGIVGEAVENYCNGISNENRETMAKVASTAAYIGTAAMVGNALEGTLPAAALTAASVAGGVGRAIYRWKHCGDTPQSAAFEGAAIAASGMMGPIAGTALRAAIPAGTLAQAAIAAGVGTTAYNVAHGDSIQTAVMKGTAVAAAGALISPNGAYSVLASAPISAVSSIAQTVFSPSLPGAMSLAATSLGVGTTLASRSEGNSLKVSAQRGAAVMASAYLLGPVGTIAAGLTTASIAATKNRGVNVWNGLSNNTKTIIKTTGVAAAGFSAAATTSAAVGLVAKAALSTPPLLSSAAVGTVTAIRSRLNGEPAETALLKGLAVGSAAGMLGAASQYLPERVIEAPAAMLLSGASGIGTAAYMRIKGKSLEATIAAGAAAATGAYHLGPLAISSIGGAAAASVAGIAEFPGETILVQIPDGPLIELTTYDPDAEPLPADRAQALIELSGKICQFRATQPAGSFWTDPHDAVIDEIKERRALSVANGATTPDLLEIMSNSLDALGIDATDAEKVEAVRVPLEAISLTPENPADMNISLVEKIEAIPIDSKDYAAAKIRTNTEIDKLVSNSSIFTTIYFIHSNRLGFVQTEETQETIKAIIRQASTKLDNGELPSLWDVYMQHLGSKLSFFQKIRARFWYFLSHTLGVIPNALNSFVKNIITQFRGTVESTNTGQLTGVFKKAFDQLSCFLDIYNGSARAFSQADEPLGNLHVYKKMAIARLGDDLLFQKVFAELKPGEDIGRKMMKELCKELTNTLIDQCFPKIELFANLKRTKLFGLRIGILFDVLDWVFGGLINFVLKEVTRFYLPNIAQSMVELGLDRTLPDQYTFKINIANSLTNLIEDLITELKNPVATKFPKLTESTLVEGAADRLVDTLNLKMLGDNPTQEQVQACLASFSNIKTPNELELRKQLVIGAQLFIHTFSTKPEKMENLFGDVLYLSNQSFEEGAPHHTELDCEVAYEHLKDRTKALIKLAVKQEVGEQVSGPHPDRLKEFLEGVNPAGERIQKGIYNVQKARGVRSFERLKSVCVEMKQNLDNGVAEEGTQFLQSLDQYAETLKEFSEQAKEIEIDRHPLAVQNAFYKTFHATYKQSISLAQEAIEIQLPLIEYDKYMKLTEKFNDLKTIMLSGTQPPETLERRLKEIVEIGKLHGTLIPGLSSKIAKLRSHIRGIETAATSAENERQLILKLQTLGNPATFTENLLADPKKWNEIVRASTPIEDQGNLFTYIRQLQSAARQEPIPDLTPLQEQIQDELSAILLKHTIKKEEKIALKNISVTNFRTVTEAAHLEMEEKREQQKFALQGQLLALTNGTTIVLDRLKTRLAPIVRLPASVLPQYANDVAYDYFGHPIAESFEPYIDATFKLITSHDVYEGSARLLMGNIVKSYPKQGKGIASTVAQCVFGAVFPAPPENVASVDN